jgi:hypothetical protein
MNNSRLAPTEGVSVNDRGSPLHTARSRRDGRRRFCYESPLTAGRLPGRGPGRARPRRLLAPARGPSAQRARAPVGELPVCTRGPTVPRPFGGGGAGGFWRPRAALRAARRSWRRGAGRSRLHPAEGDRGADLVVEVELCADQHLLESAAVLVGALGNRGTSEDGEVAGDVDHQVAVLKDVVDVCLEERPLASGRDRLAFVLVQELVEVAHGGASLASASSRSYDFDAGVRPLRLIRALFRLGERRAQVVGAARPPTRTA